MAAGRTLIPLLVTLVACTGCIQIRESISIDADGSGTAHVQVSFPQLGLRFLPGDPIADWIRPNLPPGVQLVSFESGQKKAKFTDANGKQHELVHEIYDVEISFDRVAALNDIRVRPDVRNAEAAAGGGTPGMVRSDMAAAAEDAGPKIGPFGRLVLVEDGKLLRFRRIVQEARDADEVEARMMNTPGSAAKPEMVELAGASLVVAIDCPGPVVEHNADSVDGRTLTWTFLLKDLLDQQDQEWTIEFACRREHDQ